ncbi:hypothetical protein Q1W73_16285 [Asticcacaulis sp. ZE23SCel15]|uniref:hypothetical protein n=1 Tax=Asticcacaulis sp. ZE23SCel15 TaxID=3059027 RepID=UPI00265F789A|nr:hypothetical protein [Asticcacaulis sp. ZE23SCel15]WKL57201.1 hypothetical protein Q1W73_16285 [Asticcacaulis sp. ZE23SCel15]
MRVLCIAAFMALSAPSVLAQTATCPADPVVSAGFETWATPAEVNAATNAANAPFLETGKAYKAALIATPQVTFASAPAKAQSPDSFAGLLLVHITDSGTYGVAASSGVWLDLIKDQTALKSAAHGHGPTCSGIRKIVHYNLQPGDYVLQIASSKLPDVTVQVQPLP